MTCLTDFVGLWLFIIAQAAYRRRYKGNLAGFQMLLPTWSKDRFASQQRSILNIQGMAYDESTEIPDTICESQYLHVDWKMQRE